MSWVVIFGTILITWSIVILMKKRLTISEIYTTVVFALLVEVLSDTYASFRFKAWGFFEVNKVDFELLWIVFGIYPTFATMIINWFPYQDNWWKKIIYLIIWSVFSTCYEWLSLKVGIVWHVHWNLFESFLLYPFIYYLLIIHVRFFRWIQRMKVK